MNTYSEDLRKKIIDALRRGMTTKSEAAHSFGVSRSSRSSALRQAGSGGPHARPEEAPWL
jgi:transposase-like protein